MSEQNEQKPRRLVDQGAFVVSGQFGIVDVAGDVLTPRGDVPLVDAATGAPFQLPIFGLAPEEWEKARLKAVAAWEYHMAQGYRLKDEGA